MRSTEQLEQKRRMDAKKSPPPPEDEMEDEMELSPFSPINTAACIYDRGRDERFGGINTAPSIFDRGAIFHTAPKDGQ